MAHRFTFFAAAFVAPALLSATAHGQQPPPPPGSPPAPPVPTGPTETEPAPAGTPPSAPAQTPQPAGTAPTATPGVGTSPPGAGAAAGTAADPGYGQPPHPNRQGQAPPPMYLEQPMPPPPRPRTRQYHEGFYMRMTMGAGYLWANATVETDFGDAEAALRGAGYMFDLGVGGSPAPGLVVGGNMMLQDSFDPGVDVTSPGGVTTSEVATNQSLGFFMIGPMIDAFPEPDGGFHVGGTLGIAALGLEDEEGNGATGFGGGAWAGYLWWVSSEWSIGTTLRFNLATTSRELAIGSSSESIRSLGLGFSAVYH